MIAFARQERVRENDLPGTLRTLADLPLAVDTAGMVAAERMGWSGEVVDGADLVGSKV